MNSRKIIETKWFIFWFCLVAFVFTSCKKLAGLPIQEDVTHETTTIDPNIKKSAWSYLKERALGTTANDSIFYQMYQAVLYSGIDTIEYTKPGRTFIFFHNDAIIRKTGSTVTTDCYFGKYKVGTPLAAATNWAQYSTLQVKNFLLSGIIDGAYSFGNIGTDPEFYTTLMPLNTDPLNPESLITFNIINDVNSKLWINAFPGSAFPSPGLASPGLQVRTAGIIATNGPIHVIDRVLFYQKQ